LNPMVPKKLWNNTFISNKKMPRFIKPASFFVF
jgi:hypothetical protein